ncbi:MAG: type IV pilus twitching motility protein PilT [Verrucomicrobiales bacterium]|nr:MAG: PilT/PilU family type 4a pilus ATPase [Verrucomicrobiaceae bacterium]
MSEKSHIVDYLTETRNRGGSDLHITSGAPPACRKNGVLEALSDQDIDADAAKELVLGVISESQRARLEEDLELDFSISIKDVGRFRANAHYVRGSIEGSFRYIPTEIPSLEQLGHAPSVNDLCSLRQGLILVTGVTGAGKTTTIASMIQKILRERSCVAVTIEDPIEYVFDHGYGLVKQREIGPDTHSFSNALRSALRQDPDIIVVSELRDLETIRTAITAAETGHLVISTLHTIDAPKSLDRMIDVFPADQQEMIITQLSNCLQAVVSQRLIERQDHPGRVMASEIMKINHGIRACMIERKFEQLIGLIQIGTQEGMHTIDESLAHLLINKHISINDALLHCRDQEYIKDNFDAAQTATKA